MTTNKTRTVSAILLILLLVGALASTAIASAQDQTLITAPAQTTQAESAQEPNNASNAANETNEPNEANETDKANESNEANEPNETDKANEPNEPNEPNEAQENAALAAQAKLTEAEAADIAAKANPGYTFTVDELGSQNGTVAYDLRGVDANGSKLEVQVNAVDGTIMAEADNAEYEG